MARIKLLVKHLVQFILFHLIIKPSFNVFLINKDNVIFICLNYTIGDNYILMSTISPFLEQYPDKKIIYYGIKKYYSKVSGLFSFDYRRVSFRNFYENYPFMDGIMDYIVLYCKNHKDRVFHSCFYKMEKIPKGLNVIDYHFQKMRISQNCMLGKPQVQLITNKQNRIVLNVDSTTMRHLDDCNIEKIISFFNNHRIPIFINAKSRIFKGDYFISYLDLADLVDFVEKSIMFISIRTGLADVMSCTSTDMLILYPQGYLDDHFSMKMWSRNGFSKDRIIFEKNIDEITDISLEEIYSYLYSKRQITRI